MRKGITSKGLISIMMINKVEICGVNTAKLPVLKEKEMKDVIGAFVSQFEKTQAKG